MNTASTALPTARPLASWETLAIDAVGDVIAFWGFKRNQGRLWALLYLRGEAMSASELQSVLELSKGAVSMLTRELEAWSVVERRADQSPTRFVAKSDLLQMVNNVLRERESEFLARVRADLAAAERVAHSDPRVPPAMAERVTRMRRLAELVETTLATFLKTAQLDMSGIAGVLKATVAKFPRTSLRGTR